MRPSPSHSNAAPDRAGFTLVELLIVVGLLLLLAGMTVSAINLTVDGDKVRAGARQVQSYLEGARDRAIYSKKPRGVRFLLDPTNNRTVSSMVYIAPTDNWYDGKIQMERLDDDSDNSGAADHNPDGLADSSGSQAYVVRGFDNDTTLPSPTGWVDLYRRRLLTDGARIRIPRDGGTWYTVQTRLLPYSDPLDASYKGSSYPPRLILTVAYRESPTNLDPDAVSAFSPGSGPQTYELELPPTVLPNQEPVLMPKGVVIHLDRCSDNVEQLGSGPPATGRGNKLPGSWKISGAANSISANTGFVYSSQMDVMFSPRGVVVGPAAQRGLIHFYIADTKDADRDRLEWESASGATSSVPEFGTRASDGLQRGDKIITTLFTRTGAISTHQVHPNADVLQSDRFKFAETGEVAGK